MRKAQLHNMKLRDASITVNRIRRSQNEMIRLREKYIKDNAPWILS